jgi:hypothetical protein
MQYAVPAAILVLAVSSLAEAEPIRAVVSVEAGSAAALDDRVAATLGGRVAGERALGERVALGAGVDASVMRWWDVGSDAIEDLVSTHLLAQVHVGIRLGPIRLEPSAGAGAIYYRGDRTRGWLPAYSSTVAVIRGQLRAGVRSRIAIGDLAMTGAPAFEPDTEIGVFFGAQF